jgi:pimeloyl-ACP methyl ester carboxylesterase
VPSSQLSFTARDGTSLAGEQSGDGVGAETGNAIVLLHGLTATRRYVVMGSSVLQRAGLRVISYDARGHGASGPAPNPSAYTYELLAADLRALLDSLRVERAVIAGASMGAHTAIRFALDHPERVSGLGLITPAYDPGASTAPDAYSGWDGLAQGLREGGVDGFARAQVRMHALDAVPERWRDTVATVMRQRLSMHEYPSAVADALEAVPRSRPFEEWVELERIEVPAVVVASRDEADPSHPLATAERYAAAIAGARLIVEEPGASPIAWQGGRVSRALAQLVESRAP